MNPRILASILAVVFLVACNDEVQTEFENKHEIADKSNFPHHFISFKHFGPDDGMPEGSAYDIVSDRFGYTWCRTQRGLARFENNGFRAFTHSQADSTSLFNNVSELRLDDQGILFGIAHEGIAEFNHSTNSFIRTYNPIYNDTLDGKLCFIERDRFWDISAYNRSASFSFIQDDKVYTIPDSVQDFQDGDFYAVNNSSGYFLVANSDGRTLYYTDFVNAENISFETIYKDTITGAPNWIKSNGEFLLNKTSAVLWDGRTLLELEKGEVRKRELGIDKFDLVSGISFHEQKSSDEIYVLVNYADNSSAIYTGTRELEDLSQKLYLEDDYIYHAALNSKDDITLSLNEHENYKHVVKDEFEHFVKADGTHRRFTSNIPPDHIAKGRTIFFDQSDNFWYGTWRKGIYVYSEDQQAFRQRGTQLTPTKIGVTYFPVCAIGDTTYLLSSQGVMHVPRLGKTINPPVENVRVQGVKRCGRTLVIAGGPAGVIFYDMNSHSMEQVDIPPPHNPSKKVIVQYAMIDSKDRLWAMGYNGFNMLSRNPLTNKFDPKTVLHRCKQTQKIDVMNSSASAGLFEYRNEIYITVQTTPQILKFNEETKEFERTHSPNLKGLRLPYVDSKGHHWFTSYRRGVFEYDMENHVVLREFNRENGKLPTSFVKHFQFVGEDKFLVRGEAHTWYIYDLNEDTYREYGHYQEYNWHLWNWEPVVKSDSLQLLPGSDCIFQLNKNYKENVNLASIVIGEVRINGELLRFEEGQFIEELSAIKVDYNHNDIEVAFADQNPHEERDFNYEYILEGLDKEWRIAGDDYRISYQGLSPGDYTFKVRLSAANGAAFSKERELKISVAKPWWFSTLALIFYIIGFVVIVYFIVQWRTLRLKNKQLQLEGIIEEKTQDIREQKDQIEEKQQEILDSITYAQRIQSAIMPPIELVNEHLPQNFIMYVPKDIVAGDFYWMEKVDNKVLFAAADCTGHGVPGAMVSVICNGGLNRSVREYGLSEPGEILDSTRDIVVEEFGKSNQQVKDGMDIALCSLEGNILKYAGSHNPLWIIRKGATEIEEIKATKQPIGAFDNPTPFKTHEVNLAAGDQVYIFSDGFADQFGGEKGKKFKAANFKKLLLKIASEPMTDQKKLLENAFNDWKGSLEQLDDVCVIGVRV